VAFDSYSPNYTVDPLLSRPLKLYWAGWETDTYTLQREGWCLSASQDLHQGRMQIAIKHPDLKIYGMTDCISFEYMKFMTGLNDIHRFPVLRAQLASQLYCYSLFNFNERISFKPIDAEPKMRFNDLAAGPKSIEDFAHFAEPLFKTQKIIVPEPNVLELIDRVLEIQETSRQKYFLDQAIEDNLKPKVHAQIISLADLRNVA
jgi:hypothetical protein